ncbi:MAG: hypothetical protein ACOZQL_03265 [Myxococcota bacterium]
MAHPLHSIGRTVVGSLALALVGAAVLLVVLGFGNLRRPCEFPDTAQCTFERETFAHVARLEFFSAAGCALIGAGLAVALRRGR